MRLTSNKVIKGLQQVKERKEPNYHSSALSWLFSVLQYNCMYIIDHYLMNYRPEEVFITCTGVTQITGL